MTALTVLFQLSLAALLFMLVNWIGRHSIASGYLQLSLFSKTDEAPAFNFLFRVLAPTVFLLLVAAVCYSGGLDDFLTRSYLVVVYYVLIRWSFNVLVGRGRLLNWWNQVVVGATACGLAVVVHRNIIAHRQSLLPDLSTMANELWLLVIVFVYQAANNMHFSFRGTDRRKAAYLGHRLATLRREYSALIKEEAHGERVVEQLSYAVLIYETFNRPAVYRAVERHMIYWFKRPCSLGPMQVQATERISDVESVRRGVRKLRTDYESTRLDKHGREAYFWTRLTETLARYNVRSDYSSEVNQLYSQLNGYEPFRTAIAREDETERVG